MDEGEKAEATAMDEARMMAVVFMVQLDRITIINDTGKRILLQLLSLYLCLR